jgi:sugar phosphate isomerase/epimerase
MTVSVPRFDLEAAVAEILAAGYGAIEVFIGQLGPGVFDVPGEEAHAAAARAHIERQGLVPVMLNAAGGSFDPLRQPEHAVETLAGQLRLAAALGMPRLLIWDGIHDADAVVSSGDAPRHLAESIVAARTASGLADPPIVSVELHPFTFAFEHDLLEQTAAALADVGAGICLDVAHFGVALGPDFAAGLSETVLAAVNHVHWCDSDCRTGGFHFPPGAGVVDLASLERALAGRQAVLSYDLFGWPAPREAMRDYREDYAALVERHRATLEPSA